ncbi:hypothetical protein [uncultured Allofournierella sp.]|uniref:hypothetical protein n=1 Tax=uncultured Allofournierella sp. TaxID=1940258 RepID=UPI0037533B87
MAKKLSEILMSSFFSCENLVCNCQKDTVNVAPGADPQTTLKICGIVQQPLKFSYMPQKGLNLSGNAGGVIQSNVLGKLLAIKDGDIDSHIQFFHQFGFLVPISIEAYESVDTTQIMEFVNRIKATVKLMNAIAGQINYKNIVIMAAYLLFSDPIEIALSSGNLTSCPHLFTQYLREYNSFPDINRNREVFNTGKFSVDDTLMGGANTVEISFFNAVRSGSGLPTMPGSNSQPFKHLVAMYTGLNDGASDLRLIIDFFYHYQLQRGIINDVFYNRVTYYSKNDNFELSEEMKVALVRIARIVVSAEINHFISTIRPTIAPETLEPEWRLDSLLEAIYFSIFYMKPGVEIYRECQNPSCKREVYFLVNATATNKKYCCPACGNAAAQRRSRKRKMNK